MAIQIIVEVEGEKQVKTTLGTYLNFLGKRESVKAIEILQSLPLLQNDKF